LWPQSHGQWLRPNDSRKSLPYSASLQIKQKKVTAGSSQPQQRKAASLGPFSAFGRNHLSPTNMRSWHVGRYGTPSCVQHGHRPSGLWCDKRFPISRTYSTVSDSTYETAITQQVYKALPSVNFSSGVCEPLTSYLRVLPVSDVGWSDWGSVERICMTLRQLGKLDECLTRSRHRRSMVSELPPVE